MEGDEILQVMHGKNGLDRLGGEIPPFGFDLKIQARVNFLFKSVI